MTNPNRPDEATPERGWIVGLWLYTAFLVLFALAAYLNIALLPRSWLALPHFDTVGHFVLLGSAGYLAYRASGRRMVRLVGLALPLGPLVVALLATLEEVLQVFARFRTASPTDLGADLCGIVVLYLLDRRLAGRGG